MVFIKIVSNKSVGDLKIHNKSVSVEHIDFDKYETNWQIEYDTNWELIRNSHLRLMGIYLTMTYYLRP